MQSNDYGSGSLLKWPGGKRWLASSISEIVRSELYGKYYEPFVGGGAVFFDLKPTDATLTDVNAHLINCLSVIKSSPEELVKYVSRYSNTRKCYYDVRSKAPRTPLSKAAQFLYLNRTCWGGIYRINRNGKFNVPFGNSKRNICNEDTVLSMSKTLERAQLRVCDFEVILNQSIFGDVVYLDPPYTTLGENNGFIRYNEHLFSWEDQNRLARAAFAAQKRGVLVIVSNLWHKEVLALYPGWFALKLERSSCVARDVGSRKLIHEALILSRWPSCFS